MKIEANELRYANVIEYLIKDSLDERNKCYEPTYIDWQDIRECAEDNDTFNRWHRPIPITEEILLRCGFVKVTNEDVFDCVKNQYWAKDGVLLLFNQSPPENTYKAGFGEMRCGKYHATFSRWINSLHQLQNLYWCLANKELEINL